MANVLIDTIKNIVKDFKTISVETKVLEDQENKHIKTTIDVVDGDTTFEIHKDFLTESDLSKLPDFHQKQVIESKETIARTIEAFANVAQKIGDKLEE